MRRPANGDRTTPPLPRKPLDAVYPRRTGRPVPAVGARRRRAASSEPRPQSTPSPGRARDGPAPDDAFEEGGPSLTIGVDFDGVLFDHVPYVLRGFRDAHDIDLREEEMRYWDFFQYRAVREKDLSWTCVQEVLRDIETDEALHQEPPLDDHAARVMGQWRERGHRVEVVTARDPESREATETFLETHEIPHDDLTMDVSRKLGYDVLVDDAPHNALLAAADGTLALLMDQPYNRDVPDDRNPVRVSSWTEVETQVAVHPVRFEGSV